MARGAAVPAHRGDGLRKVGVSGMPGSGARMAGVTRDTGTGGHETSIGDVSASGHKVAVALCLSPAQWNARHTSDWSSDGLGPARDQRRIVHVFPQKP